ncbi:hypothetical protein [Streptomyces sp. NPDC059862]|uniref:hypothetical protein n=1 Tax=unclassified Streptomyces TaxID=2593676 RepID=UPI003641106F
MSAVQWNRLTAAELRALAARDAVVLLPIGATEPVYMAVSFDRITESGVAGDARVASPEKGERMLSGCAAAPADIIVRDPWAK